MTARAIVFCTLAGGALLISTPPLAHAEALSAHNMPPRIECAQNAFAGGFDVAATIDASMKRYGLHATDSSVSWLRKMGSSYASGQDALQIQKAAFADTARVAELAKNGLVIAAAMAHEDALDKNEAYRSSSLAKLAQDFIGRAIEPVPHDADADESRPDTLALIAEQIVLARKTMGPIYDWRPARYYVLGHAYDDPIAVVVAQKMLCSKSLPQDRKLVIEAAANRTKQVIASQMRSGK